MSYTETTGTLDEVVRANENWWLFLIVFAVVGAFFWAARARRLGLAALGRPELLRRLVDTVNRPARIVGAVAATACVAAVIGGLQRPQYGGTAKVVPASGLDVVLVVDYSKSMLAQDVYPSRNERLEAELTHFLDDAERRGDRVGVVVFAGHPRGLPLTRDARMLKLYLERADPRTENPGGTAIGKALQLALGMLVDARRGEEDAQGAEDVKNGEPRPIPPADNDQAIILLTDGEDTESRPLEVAEKAAQLGVRIYSVGIGSRSGEPIQKFDKDGQPDGFASDKDGNFLMTRLDEELLRQLATSTGGRYIRVDPKSFGLDEVRTMLEDLSRSQGEDKIEIHRDEGFVFFVVPALVLLLVSLVLPQRRRAVDNKPKRRSVASKESRA